MKPFALKFAIPTGDLMQSGLVPMSYDPEKEMMVLTDSLEARQAIELPDMLMATGTMVTKTETDTTSDESTDR
jgi:hypothetical protein